METRHLPIASRIIPLALPKGTEKLCELCQNRAYLQCAQCRVTFYCDATHQFADWVGIHEKICPLLVPIRTETLESFSKEGRIEKDIKKRELIAIARSIAEGKLTEGKHEEALPAGQTCLHFCMDVFGPCSIQLVPAYLLLAEGYMGLGNISSAAELLSQAELSVSKNPDCGHDLHHRLHRSLGRLQSIMGDLEGALFNYANDIYHAAEVYGLDSTVCSNGYFLLANIFAKQGKTQIVRSMYNEVAQTWNSHLTKLIEPFLENPTASLEPTFDKAKQVEVDKILHTILDFERHQSRKEHALMALASLCLSMLWFMGGDRVKARDFGRSALQSSQMSPNQELSTAVQKLLDLVETRPQTSEAKRSK
ncbi:zinc finger MYND domain-containing protein 12 [Periophthalmus magnuspinnatus]|uniref:zinc finger MYND domain-containing protein 12 n=1 Tax=Periophthalmus magnuspinnatus TaxID=409849 RepID=UPI00145BED00|nr:zinc finger MYND domain-containing protein 12 [Periophthalmus magnuspinnatus]